MAFEIIMPQLGLTMEEGTVSSWLKHEGDAVKAGEDVYKRQFREDFSLEKSGIIAEKGSQIFGCRFVGFDGPKKAAPFFNF